MATTLDIVQNAIRRAKSAHGVMSGIASANTLTWLQIKQGIDFVRAAKQPGLDLINVWNDTDARGMPATFKRELGATVDVPAVFDSMITKAELFNTEAFAIFDANNTREKIGDGVNTDRDTQDVVFASPVIDTLKTLAADVATELAPFA